MDKHFPNLSKKKRIGSLRTLFTLWLYPVDRYGVAAAILKRCGSHFVFTTRCTSCTLLGCRRKEFWGRFFDHGPYLKEYIIYFLYFYGSFIQWFFPFFYFYLKDPKIKIVCIFWQRNIFGSNVYVEGFI